VSLFGRIFEPNFINLFPDTRQEKADNLLMMRLMDAHILQEPTAGVLTRQSMLEEQGYKAGYEKVRRWRRLANIRLIYPRKRLTQLGDRQYIAG
jgi:putative transposase